MPITRSPLIIIAVLTQACGGSPRPIESRIRAPSADVARLLPAEFVATQTTLVVTCKQGFNGMVAEVARTLGSISECRPAIEDLQRLVATDCASLGSMLALLTAKLEKCATSKKGGVMLTMFGVGGLEDQAVVGSGTTTTTTAGSSGVPFEAFALNAATDFVIARAKAEVLNWIAEEFGNKLCKEKDDDGVDVLSYFPTTCRVFTKDIGGVNAEVQDFGRSLQAAVQRDLRDAIARLVNRAIIHTDARLRVLLVFAARLLDSKDLANAAAYADEQTPSKQDKVVCALKIGLYAVAQLATTAFDPKQPTPLIATLNTTIMHSADVDLKAEWESWQGKLSALTQVLDAAVKARDKLKTAIEAPTGDAIYNAESRLQELTDALANAAPLDATAKLRLHEVASRLTVTREWAELALAAYQIIDGIRRGDDPVGLIVTAGRVIPCREGRDVMCATKIGILIIEAVTATVGWNDKDLTDPVVIDDLVKKIINAFDAKLSKLPDYTQQWVEMKLSITHDDKVALARSVLQQVRRVNAIVRSAYAVDIKGEPLTRDQLHEKARDLLAASRSLFALASTISDRYAKATSSEHVAKAEQMIEDVFAAWSALEDGDAGKFVVSLFAVAEVLGVTNPLPASIRQYLPLVTAIASAKTSADMKAALEKYAAPVGSYKEKRKRPWMASITALIGGGLGWEKLDDTTDNGTHKQVGLFAPIGIDVACGAWYCRGAGVMLSVLDLGNLVSVRLGDVKAPDPTFRQVFSPGLYARYNVTGPLNLGFGIAAVPELRRPESMTMTMTEPSPIGGFKAIFFVAVDVTLFPF